MDLEEKELNVRRDRRGHPSAFNEPEEDAKLSHHPTFRDPDEEPEEPDMSETGETKPGPSVGPSEPKNGGRVGHIRIRPTRCPT